MDAGKLAHKYLLIPDTTSKENKGNTANAAIWKSIDNASEWMAVTKHHFDFTGWSCNKIGVSYSRFRNQGSRCLTPVGRYKGPHLKVTSTLYFRLVLFLFTIVAFRINPTICG